MSSRSAATTSKDSASSIPINSANDRVHHRIKQRIQNRAYDLFQQDLHHHGDAMRHWLQAESEVLTTVPEIRESGSWYTINVPLRGFAPGEVQVRVEPQYAMVAAEKEQASGGEPGASWDVFKQVTFTRAKWPDEVDPATASAYLKNGVLTLTVKKSGVSSSAHKESHSAKEMK
jgi:HSP20 family molecular chaperone IbpA